MRWEVESKAGEIISRHCVEQQENSDRNQKQCEIDY